MGHPRYEIMRGSITLGSEPIHNLPADERSARGLFLSFQHIPEIPGIRLGEYLRTIVNTRMKRDDPDAKEITPFVFSRMVRPHLSALEISESFLDRDLHVGFSGGEKRKIEFLQMRLLSPSIVILDELDSGLDAHALQTIAELVTDARSPDTTFLVISHNFELLDRLTPDRVVFMEAGRITGIGGRELTDRLRENQHSIQHRDESEITDSMPV